MDADRVHLRDLGVLLRAARRGRSLAWADVEHVHENTLRRLEAGTSHPTTSTCKGVDLLFNLPLGTTAAAYNKELSVENFAKHLDVSVDVLARLGDSVMRLTDAQRDVTEDLRAVAVLISRIMERSPTRGPSPAEAYAVLAAVQAWTPMLMRESEMLLDRIHTFDSDDPEPLPPDMDEVHTDNMPPPRHAALGVTWPR